MRMNRRNVLLGLGTVVAGGGAALGTGAFSSVEADRSATITTANDSNALLELTPNQDTSLIVDNGELSLQFQELNENAVTTIDPAFNINNTGGQNVGVTITVRNTDSSTGNDAISFKGPNEDDFTSDPTQTSDNNLGTGDVDVTIEVDTTDSPNDDPTDVETIEIVADTDAYVS